MALQTSKRRKEFATLRARASMAGITLHALDNDYASRCAMTRELSDLGAVECWLDRVTGGLK